MHCAFFLRQKKNKKKKRTRKGDYAHSISDPDIENGSLVMRRVSHLMYGGATKRNTSRPDQDEGQYECEVCPLGTPRSFGQKINPGLYYAVKGVWMWVSRRITGSKCTTEHSSMGKETESVA